MAEVARVRREREIVAGVERDRAADHEYSATWHDSCAVHGNDAQRQATGIGVVDQHRDDRRAAGGGDERVVGGDRQGIDVAADSGRRGSAVTIGNAVGVGCGTNKACIRREDKARAGGVQRHAAAGDGNACAACRDQRAVDVGDRERKTVRIGIVGQHGDDGRGARVRRERVIGGDRRAVDRA